MVDQNGRTLAMPVRLTDFTFKTVFSIGLIDKCPTRASFA
jgi:hypothetical protein